VFRGSFPHSIDEKGRVAIPVKWRDLLATRDDARLVLTRFIVDGTRCLDVYPYDEWVKFEEKMLQQKRFGRAVVRFENFYISRSHDCAMDKQGRVLIPPQLRDYANLHKDIVFAGVLQKFRLWNATAWDSVDQAAEQAISDDPSFLESLDL
jgi:MraZ protein